MSHREKVLNPTLLLVANRAFVIARSRMGLVEAFRAKGWRVLVVAAFDGTEIDLRANGCEVYNVGFSSAGVGLVNLALKSAALGRVILDERPGLIHLFNAKPIMVGLPLGRWLLGTDTRIVTTVTGLGFAYSSGGWWRLVANAAYRAVLGWADHTVFQNLADRDQFVMSGLVSRSKTTAIVSSGVDTKQFLPSVCSSKERPLRIIFVGRLLWQKGFGDFVSVAEQLGASRGEVEMTVYGELAETHPNGVPQSFVKACEERSLLSYKGFVDEPARVYQEADVLLLPSFYAEGVPRAVLEACASGVVPVVAEAGWVGEVVRHQETGFVVPPRAVDQMVQIIRRLDADRGLLRSMALAGRSWMERSFTIDQILNQYFAMYRSIDRDLTGLGDHGLGRLGEESKVSGTGHTEVRR